MVRCHRKCASIFRYALGVIGARNSLQDSPSRRTKAVDLEYLSHDRITIETASSLYSDQLARSKVDHDQRQVAKEKKIVQRKNFSGCCFQTYHSFSLHETVDGTNSAARRISPNGLDTDKGFLVDLFYSGFSDNSDKCEIFDFFSVIIGF